MSSVLPNSYIFLILSYLPNCVGKVIFEIVSLKLVDFGDVFMRLLNDLMVSVMKNLIVYGIKSLVLVIGGVSISCLV